MGYAWSAMSTWGASRSASEKTATVPSPCSRQARMMRTAISPRLAIRTLRMDRSEAVWPGLAGPHRARGPGGPIRGPPCRSVHPLPHEAGVAIALARHLGPPGQESGRGQEQAIAQVGRVGPVLLEGRVGDLLV